MFPASATVSHEEHENTRQAFHNTHRQIQLHNEEQHARTRADNARTRADNAREHTLARVHHDAQHQHTRRCALTRHNESMRLSAAEHKATRHSVHNGTMSLIEHINTLKEIVKEWRTNDRQWQESDESAIGRIMRTVTATDGHIRDLHLAVGNNATHRDIVHVNDAIRRLGERMEAMRHSMVTIRDVKTMVGGEDADYSTYSAESGGNSSDDGTGGSGESSADFSEYSTDHDE
jgi:hypothetical protein